MIQARLAAAMVALALAGCTAPAAQREAMVPDASAALAAGPRFAPGGPDADDYGARDGYPKGDHTTFFRIPFLVGSHSHLDQVFDPVSRLVLVHTAVRKRPSGPSEIIALWRGVLDTFGR